MKTKKPEIKVPKLLWETLFKFDNNKMTDFFAVTKTWPKEDPINIYLCGPTVYDDLHIGNMRGPLYWDLIVRIFRILGYQVNYVQNITDVDDKIINRAREQGTSEANISKKYFQAYKDLLKQFNLKEPDEFLLVTEHMDKVIIPFIHKLYTRNFLYRIGEDWYFDTQKTHYQSYHDDNFYAESKVRHIKKKNFQDFVVWKAVSDQDDNIKWSSDLGFGRPGWHTECCALIAYKFKKTLTFHGGGYDLRMIHHPNEQVQFQAVYPEAYITKIWMQHQIIEFDNWKISKSQPEIFKKFLAKNMIKKIDLNALKLFFYCTNVEQVIHWPKEPLEINRFFFHNKIENNIKLWKIFNYCFGVLDEKNAPINDLTSFHEEFEQLNNHYQKAVISLLQRFNEYHWRFSKFYMYTNCLMHMEYPIKIIDDSDYDLTWQELLVKLKFDSKYKHLDKKTFDYFITKNNHTPCDAKQSWIYIKMFCYIFGFKYDFSNFAKEEMKLIDDWLTNVKEKNYAKADKLRTDLQKKGILPKPN